MNIYEWTKMSVRQALIFMDEMQLSPTQQEIARLILKEIKERCQFLSDVGLDIIGL